MFTLLYLLHFEPCDYTLPILKQVKPNQTKKTNYCFLTQWPQGSYLTSLCLTCYHPTRYHPTSLLLPQQNFISKSSLLRAYAVSPPGHSSNHYDLAFIPPLHWNHRSHQNLHVPESNSHASVLIFHNFPAASDIPNHQLFLEIVTPPGFCDATFSWLFCYLTDSTSSIQPLKIRQLLGLVLGPSL